MNIIPLKNKVVVDRVEGSKTTSSGIILQRTEEPDRAKVLAIGPDVDEVSIGDIILLDWNAAAKIEEHYIIPVTAIVFIYGE
jgi:co-chaperonin GroES (HSP10)